MNPPLEGTGFVLFDVTGLMTTSATFETVVEAFAMREFAGFEVHVAQPTAGRPMLDDAAVGRGTALGVPWRIVSAAGRTVQQPRAPQPPAGETSRSGMSLLNGLATESSSSLTTFMAHHPAAVSTLLASPPPATEVRAWWGTLDSGRRSSLLVTAPQLVGNLDGVPLDARGRANLRLLHQSAEAVRTGIASSGRGERFGAEQQLVMFAEVERALKPAASGERRTLLSFDPAGAGTAAIVIGDLSTADSVSVLVPGAFVLVSGQVVQWTDSAQALHDERTGWVDRTWSAGSQPGTRPTVATVAWIGYQTPGPFEVTKLDFASKGRDALARVIQGVQDARTDDEPFVSVIAHSYGSTAAMMALTEYDFEIDALAVVGSPGGLVSRASDLHVRNGAIFVGDAAWDPVAGVGFFGVDPGSPQFGAIPFGVSGGRHDPYSGQLLGSSMMHDSYFDPGSESLRNLALISLGLGDRVTED